MRAPRTAPPAPSPPKTIEDLRPLLVGPEQTRLRRLEEKLDERLDEAVAGVLPEAVVKSCSRGDALAWALAPLLATSLRDNVRRDPGGIADAIAPAMGPALRKAVGHVLRAALQRFNDALDQSLSLRSVGWRVEAWRTARPFAEVVLLRSLVYQVEQVFLIHRASGLVLQHLTADHIPTRDPDQVAAMLSAIEQFAFEAFHEDARLERFRVGDLAGWLEHGPEAILVAVVRGVAPEDYEAVLRRTLDHIHLERAEDLVDFRGDPAPFAATRDLISDCLGESRRRARAPWKAPLVATAALVAIVATFASLGVRAFVRGERRLAAYAGALREEPGLVLMEARRDGGHYFLAGLRDPLADAPAAELAQRGLDPRAAELHFEPFLSLDPRLVERRAEAILRPPSSVTLSLRDGTLEARGVAPTRWIERARTLATTLPGVSAFRGERLRPQESMDRVEAAARALARRELLFGPGSARLTAEQRPLLDEDAAEVRRLFAAASEAGLTAHVVVVGHVDPTGSPEANADLAEARAEHVVAALHARGVEGALSARGGGVLEGPRARNVVFRVDFFVPSAG